MTWKIPSTDAHCLHRGHKTSVWIYVAPSTVNVMERGAQEWRDAAFFIYGIKPHDLTQNCNVCGTLFSISRALDFKWVALSRLDTAICKKELHTCPERPS